MRTTLLLILSLLLPACSSPPTNTTLEIQPAAYPAAFDAAREAIIDCHFTLERVDADAGVITTAPKPTAGLLSPWDAEQSSFSHQLDDLTNDQRRIIRIEFKPADPPAEAHSTPATPAPPPVSPLNAEGKLIASIRVIVERRHTPGRRIEPESIRRSSNYLDIDLIVRGMQPVYYVADHDDPKLAARLAKMIQSRLDRP